MVNPIVSSAEDYYREKSYQEVQSYLAEVKKRVQSGLFKISENAESREKNRLFIRRYNLADKKQQKEVLLGIECEDFCHAVMSKMPGNEGQELFVFCRKCSLYQVAVGVKTVLVYIKLDLLNSTKQPVIVVSFHEAEVAPTEFPFK